MNPEISSRADDLDAADPLSGYLSEFVEPADDSVVAYLDGNSLGRPLLATQEALSELVTGAWGTGLIRSWTDGSDPWMSWPEQVGDLIGRACLGAAAGQTVVADSTTVLLYKLARAAVAACPGRDEIVLDRDNFPTDRYVLEGISQECGLRLVWIDTDPEAGIRPEQVSAAVSERTALVLMSHVAYRSGWLADAPAITAAAHASGALVLWDLCHSAGSVPVHLDDWGVDLAVGCTYKYLNGGPGAPAFGYVRSGLQDRIRQPIQGWMGRAEPFEMAQGYSPAPGVRSLVSGTPPIVGMVPVRVGAQLVERAGIEAIRAKSLKLTSYAIELADAHLGPLGVRVAGPREPERRGGHVTLAREDFRSLNPRLWQAGVIPDFRSPDGIRIGLSPLSTRFADVETAISAVHDLAAG